MGISKGLQSDLFSVLADPTRRRMLDVLREQSLSVNDLTNIIQIKQSGISRHLAILSKIGLVTSQKDAKTPQKHIYSLRVEPLQELDIWLESYRQLWDSRFKKLEEHLKLQKGKKNVQ